MLPRLIFLGGVLGILAGTVHAQSFLTNNLIAYYPFNGQASDVSGNLRNGAASANTALATDRFGNANAALYITNDATMSEADAGRVDVPLSAMNFSNAGTITAWVNLTDNTTAVICSHQHNSVGSMAVFSIGGSLDALGQAVLTNPGSLCFRPQNGVSYATSTVAVTNNVWQQVAVTFDLSGCTFYLNGVAAGTTSGDFHVPADSGSENNFACLGAWRGDGWGPLPQHFAGVLDDVRFYSRVLPANEIQQLYALESAPGGAPTGTVHRAVYTSFSGLALGWQYQAQISTNLIDWADDGPPFTALSTNMIYSHVVEVTENPQFYFRLH